MEERNYLKHTISGQLPDGNNYRAVLSLDDNCKNGFEHFAITGDIWEKGKARTDRSTIIGGAIGDTLSSLSPLFALFNRLHGSDMNGVPMHAISNMHYHLKNGFERLDGETQKEAFCRHYRVTPEQYDHLAAATDQEHFTALFIQLPEILANWKAEAVQAIQELEKLTGYKFKSKATRQHLKFPDNLDEIKARLKTDYYTPEKAKARAEAAEKARREKAIKELEEEHAKKVKESRLETDLKILLIKTFGTHSNVIHYSGTNERIAFNWKEPRWARYEKKWTEEEVTHFTQISPFGLPCTIKHKYDK